MEVKESVMGLPTSGATGVTTGSFNAMLTKVTEMATSAAAAVVATATNTTTTTTIHAPVPTMRPDSTTTTTPTPAPAPIPDLTTPAKTIPSPLNTGDMSTAIIPHSGSGSNIGSASPPPFSFESMKKKRGRPRKYAPDGSPIPVTPKPYPPPSMSPLPKRGRGRPLGSGKKHQQHHHLPSPSTLASSPTSASALAGDFVLGLVGAGFTPHAITVAAGEDVACKIMSFLQQDSRGVCILSANGAISNATLRQPLTSGGTLTYEGRFEILSLSGSFLVSDMPGARSRTGGLSVSLAGPDGNVIGGSVAGMLIAASPVQVVIGSFACGINNNITTTTTKPKKVHKTLTKIAKPNNSALEFSMNDKQAEFPATNQNLGAESSKGQMIAVGCSGLQPGASENRLNIDIDMSSPAQ